MSLKLPKFLLENNLYGLLEIENFASLKEIRAGYRALALKYHPDRLPGCAESTRKFTLGAQAYRILAKETLKTQYDRILRTRLRQPGLFQSRQLLRQRQKGFRQGYSRQAMVDHDYNRFIDECRENFLRYLNNLDRVKARPAFFTPASMEPEEYEALVEEGRNGFQDFLSGVPRVRRLKT